MANKREAIDAALLDELLVGRDSKTVLSSEGLFGEVQKVHPRLTMDGLPEIVSAPLTPVGDPFDDFTNRNRWISPIENSPLRHCQDTPCRFAGRVFGPVCRKAHQICRLAFVQITVPALCYSGWHLACRIINTSQNLLSAILCPIPFINPVVTSTGASRYTLVAISTRTPYRNSRAQFNESV